jgi:hypothetical protein
VSSELDLLSPSTEDDSCAQVNCCKPSCFHADGRPYKVRLQNNVSDTPLYTLNLYFNGKSVNDAPSPLLTL